MRTFAPPGFAAHWFRLARARAADGSRARREETARDGRRVLRPKGSDPRARVGRKLPGGGRARASFGKAPSGLVLFVAGARIPEERAAYP